MNLNGSVVWVVGKYVGPKMWELQGIFTNEGEAAVLAAPLEYFIGPVVIGELLADTVIMWHGAYYPHVEGKLGCEADGARRPRRRG